MTTISEGPHARVWAVILAGGVGSRFWPASVPTRPKQLLPLAEDGEGSMLAETVRRIQPIVSLDRIRILTSQKLADAMLVAVPGIGPEHLWFEPTPRGTAAALAWAAAQIERLDPGAVMVSLHADNFIRPTAAFQELVGRTIAQSAAAWRLFTIGVSPSRPETGYGYIEPGPPLPGAPGAFLVRRFVEKPDALRAQNYVDSGFLWNSGLFVWPAALLLDELRACSPEIAPHLAAAERGDRAEFFGAVPSMPIDIALLERSKRIAVARATFEWDDVGSWDAIARLRAGDDHGNVGLGPAFFHDATGCVAWSESGRVALFGVSDLVVVTANGYTLVMPRARSADLKKLLDAGGDRLR